MVTDAFLYWVHVCMGAYKCDVVVAIEIGAYIHEFLCCVGAYYPDFTVQCFCYRRGMSLSWSHMHALNTSKPKHGCTWKKVCNYLAIGKKKTLIVSVR